MARPILTGGMAAFELPDGKPRLYASRRRSGGGVAVCCGTGDGVMMIVRSHFLFAVARVIESSGSLLSMIHASLKTFA